MPGSSVLMGREGKSKSCHPPPRLSPQPSPGPKDEHCRPKLPLTAGAEGDTGPHQIPSFPPQIPHPLLAPSRERDMTNCAHSCLLAWTISHLQLILRDPEANCICQTPWAVCMCVHVRVCVCARVSPPATSGHQGRGCYNKWVLFHLTSTKSLLAPAQRD